MKVDLRLARKGRNEPRDGLAQQGRAHVILAQQHAADLHDHGWSKDDTTTFEEDVIKLESDVASQAEARVTAAGLVAKEGEGIDDAKRFIHRMRSALPRALREANVKGLTLESFAVGEKLGRSTPKISAYLTRVRPAVLAIDDHLKKHFGGKTGTEVLDTVKTALDTADASQENAFASLPAETLAVYETKGRVLEAVEDLNRAGKSAFDGQPEIAGKFNKDILLRARSSRPKKDKPAGDGKPAPDKPAAGKPATEPAKPATEPAAGKPAPERVTRAKRGDKLRATTA